MDRGSVGLAVSVVRLPYVNTDLEKHSVHAKKKERQISTKTHIHANMTKKKKVKKSKRQTFKFSEYSQAKQKISQK